MSHSCATVILLLISAAALAADGESITLAEADDRLKHAYYLAQETNRPALNDRHLTIRDGVQKAFDRRDPAAAERLVRDAEQAVGLDVGGKSMYGLPVAWVNAEMRRQIDAIEIRRAAALKTNDVAAVSKATAEMSRVLGTRAGVPDIRVKVNETRPVPLKPDAIADLFVKVVEANPRLLKSLLTGVPGPYTTPRVYASVVQGCVMIRPLVERHREDKLKLIDDLVRGCCRAMLALQTDGGYFRFPDLRGRHLRFGDMIRKLVDRDPSAVKDGWVVVADPDGETHIDVGECGMALIRAGSVYRTDEWIQAGRKAADWILAQTCVPDVLNNAVAVGFLAAASVEVRDARYLDGAWKKYEIGIAPGLTPTGRWVDPPTARTARHLVLLRGIHDLAAALPAGDRRDQVTAAARTATKSLTDEAASLGVPLTAVTVQELVRIQKLDPASAARLKPIVQQAAALTVERCTTGGRIRAGVPLPELAAVHQAWAE